MKRNLRSVVLGVGLAITSCFIGGTAFSQTVYKDYIDGEIWFRLKSDKIVHIESAIDGPKPNLNKMKLSSMPYLRDVFTSHSVTRLIQPFPRAFGSEDLMRTYRVEFADINNVDAFITQLEESGAVVYAEKVPLMKISLTPNDPNHNSSTMWGLFQINAEQAWNVGTGSSTIVVATTDNAIQITHPDLANVLWTNPGEIPGNNQDDDNNGYIDDVNGVDVGDGDGNPNPPNNNFDHGTHVAGTTGAETNNNTGVSSIGFGISIMAVKSTRNNAGSNSVTNGYDGIYYAADKGADIINCSWGGTGFSTTGQNVVNWATAQGSIVVAAAGNDGTDNDAIPHYPSNYSNAVAVASTTTNDVKSGFSNYGANSIDISAPGSNIASTVPTNNYGYMSGTSMATPMVSGLLGLMKSLNPAMPNANLLNCLYSTAVNINGNNPSYSGELGAGRIDAFAAMNCVAASLSNPPNAEFTANFLTIPAGGSVTFTDQTTFGPTTWSWDFDNQNLGGVTPGTANTQGPHIVTYANAGVYEVSLTCTNANGSDTETKTAYITVTPPGSCNELNLTDNSFAQPSYGHPGWNLGLYYAPNPGDYISGSNGFGDRAVAEYFPSAMVGSNAQYVEGVYFITGNVTNGTSPNVTMNVWDGTGGAPTGAPLGSRTFNLGDLAPFTIYYRPFDNPIQVPASSEIAVGFDFSALNPAAGDTFTVFTNRINEVSTSTGFWQDNTNAWTSYGSVFPSNLSLYVYPQLTATPSVATLSANPLTICEGDLVHYDATGSTYQDTLLWSFPGQNPNQSNTVMDSIIYTTAGTYTTYLEVVGGGCSNYEVDSVTIVVNPTPSPTITSSADTVCSGATVNLSTTGGGTYSWTPGGQTSAAINVTPTSNTSYSVAVTAGGCTGETSKTIYVDGTAPTAAASFTPSTNVCVGENVTFDGTGSTGANNYSWSFPAGSPSSGSSTAPFPIISYGASGTHNYSVTVSNTCGSNTFNGSITVNALPTVTANVTSQTICLGDPITFTGSGTATGYTWDNGVTDGVPFTPASAGTVVYTVTGSDGTCSNTDNVSVTVNICTGIEDVVNNEFVIYPNPTNNIVNVTGLENVQQITLLDVTGKLVYSTTNITSNTLVIDLSTASNGLYFMQVQTTDGLESYKIVKQ